MQDGVADALFLFDIYLVCLVPFIISLLNIVSGTWEALSKILVNKWRNEWWAGQKEELELNSAQTVLPSLILPSRSNYPFNSQITFPNYLSKSRDMRITTVALFKSHRPTALSPATPGWQARWFSTLAAHWAFKNTRPGFTLSNSHLIGPRWGPGTCPRWLMWSATTVVSWLYRNDLIQEVH